MKRTEEGKPALLNVGCGNRFHPDWINVDVVSRHKEVMECNILKGIPFPDNSMDAVYHSHVLEHFPKAEGERFIRECHRVLKSGGILRIAVPDLERIARTYLEKMELAAKGDSQARHDYNWMMLELYDQTIRNESGGEMKDFITQEHIPNEDFVYTRVGAEARDLREALAAWNKRTDLKKKIAELIRSMKRFRDRLPFMRFYSIGKFRNRGEIHYRMYDRYSLIALLTSCGFVNARVTGASASDIAGWSHFGLDEKNGVSHKPDSLFVEAVKPRQSDSRCAEHSFNASFAELAVPISRLNSTNCSAYWPFRSSAT
jgi:predicted SAM-dependent methyltransferase